MHISRRSLALLACAIFALQTVSAMQDHDHDHDHDHDSSTTTWSCSAKCDGSVAADKICGGKNVSTASTLGLGTCAETKKAIFDVPKYATSAHMVPCDPGYCKMCTAAGEKTMMGSTVTCYNNSVTMYANKTDANDHALARGCKGSHEMMSKFMPGETHALCASGKNYFDDIPVASGAGDVIKVILSRRA